MPWSSALHRRQDRLTVLGQDDQRVRTLRDQVLDVGQLLLGRRSGVARDVLGPAGLKRVLDRGLVPLGPALFVVVVPRDPDGELFAAGRRARCPGLAAIVVPTARGEQDGGQREEDPYTPSQHVHPLFWTERPCDVPASRSTNRTAPAASQVRPRPVEGSGALGRPCLGRAPTWHIRAERAIRLSCCRHARRCGLLRPFEAPDSLPARAPSRIAHTIRDRSRQLIARQGRMQSAGSTTHPGTDSGDGGQREPRPDAGRPDRGRRTALWLVLGAVGGALVALAVVLAVGLALTSAGETAAEAPASSRSPPPRASTTSTTASSPTSWAAAWRRSTATTIASPTCTSRAGERGRPLPEREPDRRRPAVREGLRSGDRSHPCPRGLPDRHRR